MWLFLAFIAVPLIEIALFIQIGGAIGLGWTLAIVVLTALIGTSLMRAQGAMAMSQIRSSLSEVRDPTEPLVNGAMILFAGALLLTPGFFTDAIGFSLLVPGIRSVVFQAIRSRVSVSGSMNVSGGFTNTRKQPHRPMQGDVIDGEYHELSDDENRGQRPSGWTKH
ncbi:MAG: FxsA family protein [Sulfitobacter sp.]|uniref:FxsA family protein n=1 Tax=uncultured Sulfitobacter sp. TaxID=191468 RepID=UPI001A09E791|nr:FxsA family protein [Sulfitobacter sp.]|tara:strand:- start:106238 stop:106735 length:498 start_codon:yes stop_codon:yes gene_type:complete